MNRSRSQIVSLLIFVLVMVFLILNMQFVSPVQAGLVGAEKSTTLASKIDTTSVPEGLTAVNWDSILTAIAADQYPSYSMNISPFQVAKLTATDAAAEDYLGISVSLSGNTALIGSYSDDDNGLDSGSAYIFERNQGGTNNWGQVAKLIAADGDIRDFFGWSVSLSEDIALVGALDYGTTNSGAAYIFERN